jgi:hypothetical protein
MLKTFRVSIFAPVLVIASVSYLFGEGSPAPFSTDTNQVLERSCFQTGKPWTPQTDLRSDVAIVYGIDSNLPARAATWRDQGCRVHVITGAAWGEYHDYLYGRIDGTNHEDEVQADRDGHKIGHGGDVYYISPGIKYGNVLCVGVQRARRRGRSGAGI